MRWVVSTVGALIVVVALWDVFHTLWHPTGNGRLSAMLIRLVSDVGRRIGAGSSRVAGPLGMAIVITVWAGLVVAGWALIYWPHLADGFSYGVGLDPTGRATFLDAVYLSAVTLTTVGFGDIVPTSGWLRLVTPLEGLVGFGLLSAAVSWVLQVYPALTRRRALALRLAGLRLAATATALRSWHPTAAYMLLSDLTDRIGQAQTDFRQYAETYYFEDPTPATSLGATLEYAHVLATEAQRSESLEVRHGGAVLAAAVTGLAELLDDQYLRTGGDVTTILQAYADRAA